MTVRAHWPCRRRVWTSWHHRLRDVVQLRGGASARCFPEDAAEHVGRCRVLQPCHRLLVRGVGVCALVLKVYTGSNVTKMHTRTSLMRAHTNTHLQTHEHKRSRAHTCGCAPCSMHDYGYKVSFMAFWQCAGSHDQGGAVCASQRPAGCDGREDGWIWAQAVHLDRCRYRAVWYVCVEETPVRSYRSIGRF